MVETMSSPHEGTGPGTTAVLAPRDEERAATGTDRPWTVVVWDDPVNLMSYVVFVFQEHFGYSTEKSRTLMLQVHEEGRAAVFSGTLEEAEQHTSALHAYGLWATFEQSGK